MLLMAVLAVLGLVGVALTVHWSGVQYRAWEGPELPETTAGRYSQARVAALRYGRGVAVALVGGFWAGALVTGPAVRLIMRLLAVTSGAGAQGRLTEANEVVGSIDLDGTISLYLFGGLLPGLASGAVYVLIRRWLPSGRIGGLTFGALHLIVLATRIDPLRADNPDFGLLGPDWLSVVTFSLACLLHGMAVAAFANRYSAAFPPRQRNPATNRRALLPMALPVLLLIPGATLLIPIALGLVVAIGVLTSSVTTRAARSHVVLLGGRVLLGATALALLPGTLRDLFHVLTSSQ